MIPTNSVCLFLPQYTLAGVHSLTTNGPRKGTSACRQFDISTLTNLSITHWNSIDGETYLHSIQIFTHALLFPSHLTVNPVKEPIVAHRHGQWLFDIWLFTMKWKFLEALFSKSQNRLWLSCVLDFYQLRMDSAHSSTPWTRLFTKRSFSAL